MKQLAAFMATVDELITCESVCIYVEVKMDDYWTPIEKVVMNFL